MPVMPFGVEGQVGRDDFFSGGGCYSQQEGAIFWKGGIRLHIVTYRKHVALHCEYVLPTADWLDLSAVGIVQPVAHELGSPFFELDEFLSRDTVLEWYVPSSCVCLSGVDIAYWQLSDWTHFQWELYS